MISNTFADSSELEAQDRLDLVRSGLEASRKRLLDLSSRNKLISFRHSRLSLRFVDVDPDAIFKKLMDGERLPFRVVPEPPVGSDRPPAPKYAAERGWAPSYDLGGSNNTSSLPVLLYEEDFMAMARKLALASRSALEESGAHVLHLVFGFLYWQESADSEISRLAPLLVVPVNFVRGKDLQLEWTGDELGDNLSLVEKMRRDFGLEVPLLAENDTPSSYFSRFDEILAKKHSWALGRQLTMGLLSFGKLRMYLDLDEERWPAGKRLVEHPLLTDIFTGQDAAISFAEEHAIDSLPSSEVPPLITDADSSQHSALIDVYRGKNIVIEGPPGTGKSTTITNMIGAAFAQNKTVLFVSEKAAALEVVKRRLDSLGLGEFCLDLHSHQTNKVGLLESLSARIEATPLFKTPAQLDLKRKQLAAKRDELTQYVRSINSPIGASEDSVFSLIWRRELLSHKIPPALRISVDAAVFPEAPTWDSGMLFSIRSEIALLSEQAVRILESENELTRAANPWWWVDNHSMGASEQERLGSLVAEARTAIEDRLGLLAQLEDWTGGKEIEWSLASVGTWLETTSNMPALPRGCPYLDVLANPDELRNVTLLLKHASEYLDFLESAPHADAVLTESGAADIDVLSDALSSSNLAKITGADLASLIRLFPNAKREMNSFQRELAALSEVLEIPHPATVQEVWTFLQTVPLMDDAVSRFGTVRGEWFLREGLSEELQRAHARFEEVNALRFRITAEFDLGVGAVDELEEAARVIESTPAIARRFNGRYRACISAFNAAYRKHDRPSPTEIATKLKSAALAKRRVEEFQHSTEYPLLGSHFRGMETPWLLLEASLAWHKKVEEELASSGFISIRLRKALLSMTLAQLRRLLDIAGAIRSLQSLSHIMGYLVQSQSPIAAETIDGALQQTERIFAAAQKFDVQIKMLSGSHAPFLEALPSNSRISELIGWRTNPTAQRYFGSRVPDRQAIADLRTQTEIANAIHNNEALPPDVKRKLLVPIFKERWEWLTNWIEKVRENDQQIETIRTGLAQFSSTPLLTKRATRAEISKAGAGLKHCIDQLNTLPMWVDILGTGSHLESEGAGYLVKAFLQGKVQAKHLPDVFEWMLADSLVREAFARSPQLWKMHGSAQDRARALFASLDEDVIQLTRQEIASKTAKRHVPPGRSTGRVSELTELALVLHEIVKQRGHIPVRKLMERAGQAILGLKPCFMMSPLSVSQYLPIGSMEFDLVVIDEASQLRPEDAQGVLIRGKQIVIVGDTKQLPPTSFFQRSLIEEESEDVDGLTALEGESILDVALTRYQPARRLRWHYRSRHHSLIEFSNRHFYGGQLVVFPSAYQDHPLLGVKYVEVAGGVFENRRNMPEAQRIVDAILAHIERNPSNSLGVVTMNVDQSDLIRELLEHRVRSNAAAAAWIEASDSTPEPFFIKHLEAVQGDERDAIFVSVTYGPDASGNVYQRFAGVNSASGHRRLNVMISRAKLRTVVFSSLSPDKIVIRPDTPPGVSYLKDYLEFARGGGSSRGEQGAETENEHEEAVASMLREAGYSVVPQVGVSGYFIDLGVRSRNIPGAFLLAIEFDGATYHSGLSTRDRDRLRQMTLESQGWKLHRIWSTDFYKNPRSEVDRLLRRLRALEDEEKAVLTPQRGEQASANAGTNATESEAPAAADAVQ